MQGITYWVIRYVPNVARGEFQNIGIVCGSDGGDWAVGFDWQFVHSRVPRDVLEWAQWFSRQVHQSDAYIQDHEFTRAWVEGIRTRQANSIQIAPPMPIGAATAHDAAETLFEHLVLHERPTRKRRVTRRQLRSEVRFYLDYNLIQGRDYFERPAVQLGQMRADFDFVQVNEQLPVIRNVWAFDVAGLDDLERSVQAWNYGITRLRDDGATMLANDRSFELPGDSVITAIIDPPRHESQRRMDIYRATLESWEREHVDVLTLDQFEERAAQAQPAR
jgi:hypothetical protein